MSEFAIRIGRLLFPVLGLALLGGCSDNAVPDDELNPVRAPEIARIMPAQEAIAGSHIPTLDPTTMNEAEIRKAIGVGGRCEFRYTRAGKPVLAVSTQQGGTAAGGIVKLSGNLVPLTPASAEGAQARPGGFLLLADPVRVAVIPLGNEPEDRNGVLSRDADMIFEIGQDLRAGYRGYLDCMSEPPAKSPRH